jgi:hypothetical protein
MIVSKGHFDSQKFEGIDKFEEIFSFTREQGLHHTVKAIGVGNLSGNDTEGCQWLSEGSGSQNDTCQIFGVEDEEIEMT